MLLFLAVVGISSSNDGGPLPPIYALCAGELFVCATWFTIALISIEDPAHRAITIVSAGNSRKVLLASVSVAVISCSVLAVFGLALPVLVGAHAVNLSDLVLGVEAELTCAAIGISIGLLCSRLVIRRQGYALVIAIGLVMTMLLVRGLPPVNVLFRLMANATTSADLIVPASGLLAIAFTALIAGAIATQFIATRRD
ncbi:MAG: hypothetical protein ACRDS0_14405 [Pseudonocardiaceae bacterium]